MNKNLILLFCLLFINICYSQRVDDSKTWKDFSLQGKVKYIQEQTIGVKKKGKEHYTLTFNKDGNILYKSEKYDKRINEAIYSYNSDKKIEKISYINQEDGKEILNTQITFRYQNDSVFVKSIINDKGKTGEKNFVMIMENDLVKKYYGNRREDLEEYFLEYDEHQNLISETEFKNGEFDSKKEYQYTYDENGNLTRKTFYEGSTVILFPNGLRKSWGNYTYEYLYDSFGNWINQIIYENGKKYQENERKITYFQ